MTSEESTLVSSLEIRGLFGSKYLHVDLTGEDDIRTQGRRLSLLYGNNGSGKTTVLKLLWHALSPSDESGHRSEIASTPFERFTITLGSGDVINFVKTNGPVGDFTVTVANNKKRVVEQIYRAREGKAIPVAHAPERSDALQQKPLFEIDPPPLLMPDHLREDAMSQQVWRESYEAVMDSTRVREIRHDTFVRYLKNLKAGPYMLADDRRIYGDDIEPKGKRRRIRFQEFDYEAEEERSHGVAAELTTALKRSAEMIQRMIIRGNVSGSRGSNNVYLGILEKIAKSDQVDSYATTRQDLSDKLKAISHKTEQYSKYGLVPKLREDSFLEVLRRTPDEKIGVAEDVLQPFLEAQEARLDALSSVARLVATLSREVNRFLESSGKTFRYSTQHGISVISEDGHVLQPESLSSGERQILLLLLNTMLARQSTRLFLIDEPELSLNVKWQRQLMNALLSLTEGAPVQFIVATHSIEVITGHRDSLTRVIPKILED
ncbi:AAA family ATPase [Streptomyces sp. NPDC050439]|uniref:AAA family ATPase n=1 Tax=unclassified Streptomyces TaxID=2593676 RepID=UPI00342445B1